MSCCADCAAQRGSRCPGVHMRSVVTGQGITRLRAQFDGEDQTTSIRPPWVWDRPQLLSVEYVIERIENLRSLIPEQVPGDG